MKYIEKSLEDNRTGAAATCHIINGITTDYTNATTIVTVASYVSQQSKAAGKESLSVSTFTLPGVPAWDVIPYEWALNELIKPQPDNFVPESYAGYINPYTFAGGEVKGG